MSGNSSQKAEIKDFIKNQKKSKRIKKGPVQGVEFVARFSPLSPLKPAPTNGAPAGKT